MKAPKISCLVMVAIGIILFASGAVQNINNGSRYLSEIGAGIIGRAVTETLYVCPNGNDVNGKSWATAYTTIQGALTAASTDADDNTLILISPHATHYNIDTTGDPTFTGNYILKGSHRNWAKIKNTHETADSILKFTGKVALIDLNFNLHTADDNGVILTHSGSRVYHCQFVGEDLGGAATALHLDHASGGKHCKVIDCDFLGHATRMTALLIDQMGRSNFERLRIHNCGTAIQIVGANADQNIFSFLDIGDCALGLDLDAGNEQHFYEIILHHNTADVDDEVTDHIWVNIHGAFPNYILPDNFTGVTLTADNAANTWGNDTEIIAANTISTPFRVVGAHFGPNVTQWYRVQLSADSGATHFNDLQFDANKREGNVAPPGTEFIFNADTRISGRTKAESGGQDTVVVWLEIQEI